MAGRRTWRVGTRGSRLALAQTEWVLAALRARHPDHSFRIITIRTRGDADRTRDLAAFDTVGVFVKELEGALLAGEIDLAVHSAKDLPTLDVPGLTLAAFPRRAAAHDVIVCARAWPVDEATGLPQLPAGAVIGTSSVRRRRQILSWRADAEVRSLRGNVDTRLRRLAAGDYDAIVLAAAGLQRLGLLAAGAQEPGDDGQAGSAAAPVSPQRLQLDGVGALHVYPLPPEHFVPAPGQGALAVQVRAGDAEAQALVGALDDPATAAAVRAERAFLAGMGSSCQVPIGALARVEADRLRLITYYAGARPEHRTWSGDPDDPESVGRRAAEETRASVAAGGLDAPAPGLDAGHPGADARVPRGGAQAEGADGP